MRIVNGCLRPTPVKYLPVLLGIAPPALRREHHTAMLVKKALLDTSHLLNARITTAQNLGRQRLRSRQPFSRHAKSNFNLMEQWKHDWQETTKPAQFTIPPGTGADLPRREWVTLNCLRTGVGRFGASMYRWGLSLSAACLCGAPEQMADYILSECTRLGPPMASHTNLTNPCPATVEWLRHLHEVQYSSRSHTQEEVNVITFHEF